MKSVLLVETISETVMDRGVGVPGALPYCNASRGTPRAMHYPWLSGAALVPQG